MKSPVMKLSGTTLTELANLILGEADFTTGQSYRTTTDKPYRTGKEIAVLFNAISGFEGLDLGGASRFDYTMQKLLQFNQTERMFQLVEGVIGPSTFKSFEQCQQSIGKFARCLRADGWMINQSKRLRSSLKSYEIEQIYFDNDGDLSFLSDEEAEAIFEPCFELVPMSQDDNRAAHVIPDVSFLTSDLFLKEEIQKANAALQEEEYARAITLARTLAEQVQFSIFEHKGLERPEAKGDLAGIYKHTKKILNLDPSNEDLDKALKKILSGLISILDGLGPLSSDAGDRHAMTYNL